MNVSGGPSGPEGENKRFTCLLSAWEQAVLFLRPSLPLTFYSADKNAAATKNIRIHLGLYGKC